MNLNKQELATVLAALRLFQKHPNPEMMSFDNSNDIEMVEGMEPLTSKEINNLCDRLHTDAQADQGKGITAFPVCPTDGSAWSFYDGALGYESLTCPTCGIDINDITRITDKLYAHSIVKEALC